MCPQADFEGQRGLLMARSLPGRAFECPDTAPNVPTSSLQLGALLSGAARYVRSRSKSSYHARLLFHKEDDLAIDAHTPTRSKAVHSTFPNAEGLLSVVSSAERSKIPQPLRATR